MRIAALSDIHYSKNDRKKLEEMITDINNQNVSVIILAGDIAKYSPDDSLLKECLSLFESFPYKMLVPGNHDLWEDENQGKIDTLKRYQNLKNIADEFDFYTLDFSPLIIQDTAFVGNMGWYDWTLHQKESPIDSLKIVRENKCTGKMCISLENWKSLNETDFEKRKIVCSVDGGKPEEFEMQDNFHIDIGKKDSSFSDRKFCRYLTNRLENHLNIVYGKVDKIVCVSHMVPHFLLLEKTDDLFKALLKPFMGSVEPGKVILKEEYRNKIITVIYGHWHKKGVKKIRGIDFFNVAVRDFSGNYNSPTIIEI